MSKPALEINVQQDTKATIQLPSKYIQTVQKNAPGITEMLVFFL